MIDPERLLGGLVRNAIGGGRGRRGRRNRRRLRRGMGGAVLGMGVLGVAFAAFEHFTHKPGEGADRFTGQRPIPPPPTPTASGVPPPPPPPAPERSTESMEAMLLIRAMIAAANADHEVDADERARILEAELESPWDLAKIAAEVSSPALARQIYLGTLLAIDVDTRAEENYLRRLADALALDAQAVAEVEALVETDP